MLDIHLDVSRQVLTKRCQGLEEGTKRLTIRSLCYTLPAGSPSKTAAARQRTLLSVNFNCSWREKGWTH